MDYQALYSHLYGLGLTDWISNTEQFIARVSENGVHGDFNRWQSALTAMPDIKPSRIELDKPWITVGDQRDCDESTRKLLEQQLRVLMPWRKGPYNIFGIDLDTEWRSDLKWDRLKPFISPLSGRVVLDVGCGSGYHCWRMQGEGARLVIGIDPTLIYCMQYQALQKYIHSESTFVLPYSTDNLPATQGVFDSVFSMGVLYHRRSPIDHLTQLWDWLCDGGELILETLVIEGAAGRVLMPEKRYAKMRNVWFIPSCETLELWLRRCNYINIRCVDVNQTTAVEQRGTDWMHFESLVDFLDPQDPGRTVEGYPAPRRAIFVATKP